MESYQEYYDEIVMGIPLNLNIVPLYIDTENYDVHVKRPINAFSFEVDPLIAPSISILNKKGYRTIPNSCEGHTPLMKNGKIIEDIRMRLGHIAFAEDIELPSYPEGYYPYIMTYGSAYNNCLVSDLPTRVYKYDDNGRIINLTEDEITELINIQCENLENWANNLPTYKKRK